MSFAAQSPCKVNLLLNILGKRTDGFHELETIMQPVALCDTLEFIETASEQGVTLTSNKAELPTDATNLVHRAATAFLKTSGVKAGFKIHLEKRVPMAAGLGGGSANAATTLTALNARFGRPLDAATLQSLAASLGSDVPFFLQHGPALATGRGEVVVSLDPFPALKDTWILLIHPGFGIATSWAYQTLARYPEGLNGRPGRAHALIEALRASSLEAAAPHFFNSLEFPALDKYPVLALYQRFLRNEGAAASLMSGSGSTTFAIFHSESTATRAMGRFLEHFGSEAWTAVVPLQASAPASARGN